MDEIPSIVHEVLQSPGQPLDSTTREFMESRFGHDFSKVRVHADARAAESARAVNAQAYTVGRDVVFGAGQFVPGTHAGKGLLEHELTHVLQQGAGSPVPGSPVLQWKPDEKAQRIGDLELPWKRGNYSLFEDESAGIRFLVGVSDVPLPDAAERRVRAAIPEIGNQIVADNAQIKNPSSRVMICFTISETSSRFALWQGNPVIVLDTSKATAASAAHEMGHAIFHALKTQAESKTKDAAKAANFRSRVEDIYARLGQTKPFTADNETHPAGHWIADPSQWAARGSAKEHPWDDPDEFFASARKAYQPDNRKGFKSAIARFKIRDPKVGGPATELLALLDAFFKKAPELPPLRSVPEVRAAAAKSEPERATGESAESRFYSDRAPRRAWAPGREPDEVSKVEYAAKSGSLLDWLLNPGNRPGRQKARPSVNVPNVP